MSHIDAYAVIAAKLAELNRSQFRCGLPSLHHADLTWGERAMELQARANLLAADGPSMDVLASLGAHLVAAIIALDEAELADPSSGQEAA